jgi:hypothetical protein
MPERKGKTKTIIISNREETRTNLQEETRTRGTITLRGEITTNTQEWNNKNIQTKFPCSLCSEYGHYTHHFPQILDFKWMKEFGNGPHPPAPPAPQ